MRSQRKNATPDALIVPVRQVAARIGVSAATLEKHPEDFFQILKFGGHKYVRRSDFTAWLAEFDHSKARQVG